MVAICQGGSWKAGIKDKEGHPSWKAPLVLSWTHGALRAVGSESKDWIELKEGFREGPNIWKGLWKSRLNLNGALTNFDHSNKLVPISHGS
ncbi:hypothetical protein KFK09_017913 [Dendrobium nobile]|uniref:Uncharacterized protein n=1 Tax=Dendrobium nobile TaxID=94219 RepID=A0A8T3AZS0_DENNO|nr:hypothetical protein KFK09_017913 [Dendrobium nobile]